MRILLLSCMLFSLMSVEDNNPLPIDAQKIISVLNYQIADLQTKAVKDLKKIQDAQMKAGNLDGALAVRDAANTLTSQIEATASISVLGIQQEPVFIGSWAVPERNVKFTVETKGTSFCGGVLGTWVFKDKQLILTWSNGYIDTYKMSDKNKDEMIGTNNHNAVFKAFRIAEQKP